MAEVYFVCSSTLFIYLLFKTDCLEALTSIAKFWNLIFLLYFTERITCININMSKCVKFLFMPVQIYNSKDSELKDTVKIYIPI